MGQDARTALVTGASRGIGRAIAEHLGQKGLKVAVNYRQNEAEARLVADRIRAAGGEAEVFGADVTEQEAAQDLVSRVQDHFGGLDVLVNNAGIARDTLLLRMRREDWEGVLAADLSSVFYCTHAAARRMVRQHYGRIINITSVAGLVGNPGQANYAAAKAGIIGFTKSVAKELASRGITANAVAPGLVETDLLTAMSEAQREEIIRHIPLARVGRPEEIAAAVSYLVDAEYVTGQVLVVDGGLAMQ